MSIDAWLESSERRGHDSRFEIPSILGRSRQGVVSWNMNDTCNYRCSYCTQRHMADRTGTLPPEELERILQSFKSLPGSWEIKLSGGEPFRQPGLDSIASGLVALGHCISIQTNFSASREKLESFLESTRGALHLFSASLHLEHATPQDFWERFQWIQPFESYGVRFHVTSVAVPSRLVELRDVVAPFFREKNIPFKIQPEKVDGYVRPYTDEERSILEELGGHNLTGEIANNFQGRLCRSGANYLVIKSSGNAYRCYPASRLGGKHAQRGSLSTGLELLDAPKLCPYTYCNCTVPIQRGMIEGHSVSGFNEELD